MPTMNSVSLSCELTLMGKGSLTVVRTKYMSSYFPDRAYFNVGNKGGNMFLPVMGKHSFIRYIVTVTVKLLVKTVTNKHLQ
jgi:hypothetical protein